MSFYEKLTDLCKKNGLTVTALSEKLGFSSSAGTSWKNMKNPPRPSTVKKIADYFGVSIDYFTEDEFEKSSKSGVKIPVFASVAAGIPIEAIEDVVDYEEIDEKTAQSGTFFALKIRGNSMEPRICNGDVVIVRQQPTVDSGDIAIVIINGMEATCKKIIMHKDGIELVSLNTFYKPMFYSNEQIEQLPVRVLGKVIELRGKF